MVNDDSKNDEYGQQELMVFTLQEICIRCQLPAEEIVEMVEYGIVEPAGATSVKWQFTTTDLLRLRKARRIRRDLAVNLAGIALSLELMDHIDALQRSLRERGVQP